jgi:hypothetical protein
MECNSDIPEVENEEKIVPFNKQYGRHAWQLKYIT